MFRIPRGLAVAIRQREGDAGERWLQVLPDLIEAACRQWGCTITGEACHGELAIVIPVERVAELAALKVSFPHPDNSGEARALRHFDGAGAIRLLEASTDGYTLLVERAGPKTLESVPSVEEAIEAAGDLVRQLAVPAPPGVTSLASATGPWLEQLEHQVARTPDLLTPRMVERTCELIADLATDATETMLHADLHFGNVLSSTRQPWLAIDPKGWSGTGAFDAFTVIAGKHQELQQADDVGAAIIQRIRRFTLAAHLDPELSLMCCQARAASAYLHQVQQRGDWFDLHFLRCLLQL